MVRIECVLPNTEATFENQGFRTDLTPGHVTQQISVEEANSINVKSGAVIYTDEDGFLAVVAMGTRKTLLEVWPIAAVAEPVVAAPAPTTETKTTVK